MMKNYIKKFVYNDKVAKGIAAALNSFHSTSVEINNNSKVLIAKNYKYRVKAYFYGVEILNKSFTYNKIKNNQIFYANKEKLGSARLKAEDITYKKMTALFQKLKEYRKEYNYKKLRLNRASSYNEIQNGAYELNSWYNNTVLPTLLRFNNYMVQYSELFGQNALAFALRRMGYSDYYIHYNF